MALKIVPTAIDDVVVLIPDRFGDNRGFFCESWNKRALENAGLNLPDFVQDNHSLSRQVATVRGMHSQAPPYAQNKLVRCGRGRILDVVIDARVGSPTYGQWVSEELSFDNGKQMLVPIGFLHGFMTLEPDSEIIYKCTDYYAPESEASVHWASCCIDWPLGTEKPIVSPQDERAVDFKDFVSPFTYEGKS